MFEFQAMLWGGAAASAPVIIHLLNKQRYKRIEWAAMEWLRNAFRKTHRRLRLEELLLLLIRTLILLLVPLALARPVFSGTVSSGIREHHRILAIDVSASMGYREGGQTRFDRALQVAESLLADHRGDVSVVAVGAVPELRVPLHHDPAEIGRTLGETVEISDGAADWVACFRDLPDVCRASKRKDKEVHLITDLQRHGWDGLRPAGDPTLAEALAALGDLAAVRIHDVGVEGASNLQVADFRIASRFVTPDRTARFTARIVNRGRETIRNLEVSLLEGSGPGAERRATERIPEIPPGPRGEEVEFTHLFADSGSHVLQVQIPPDGLRSDDARALAVPVRSDLRVLLIDGEPGTLPEENETFYAETALRAQGGRGASPVKTDRITVYALGRGEPVEFARYDAVLLANVGYVADDLAVELDHYVREGGAVLFFAGGKMAETSERHNDVFFADGEGVFPARIDGLVSAEEYNRDFFTIEPTAEQRLISGWDPELLRQYVHLRTFVRLEVPEGPARTVHARFNDPLASPAFVEYRRGLGRVLAVATTADRDWGMLADILPWLLRDALFHLVGGGDRDNLRPGEIWMRTFPPAVALEDRRVILPDGSIKIPTMEPRENRRVVEYPETDRIGVYTLEIGPSGSPDLDRIHFTVGADPAEGDLARIGEDLLQENLAGLPFDVIRPGETDRPMDLASIGGGRIWRWLLMAACVLLLLETLLAWRFSSRT